MSNPDHDTRHRLAAETGLDVRTIDRVLRGKGARRSTARAVEVAARKLRIALPSSTGAV